MRKRKFSKHFDKAHSIMFSGMPSEYTKILGVPGVFVKKINRMVHLKDGTGGEMDSAYIADPDYKLLFERVAVALEHQSKPVGDEKLEKIGDYDIQLVVDEHLPTLICIASHLNDDASKKQLVRSPSDITRPYFLDLGEDNISKRLSMVDGIINSNKYLSKENALNLGVIVLFAPRNHACEITERVVNLYIKISRNLDFRLELALYSVIVLMIDAYFDEEKNYERLMNMVNDNTSSEVIEDFHPFDGFRESLEYANKRILDLEEENSRIPKLEAEISRIHDLEVENSKIPDLVAKNSVLEARIKELEDQINGK